MPHQPTLFSFPSAVVVNDDPTQLFFLAELLRRNGFEVDAFEGPKEALSAMDPGSPPDLVVTDLHMPSIDGWRFCRLLRSREFDAFNDVPILVVSATFAGGETSRITADLGANAFLPAPVNKEKFIGLARSLVAGEETKDHLRILIVEDDPTFAGVLRNTFERHGYQADTATTVLSAVEAAENFSPDVVVIDYHLPDGTGDDLLPHFRKVQPDTVCIMMATDPSPELALDWMARGAAAYLRMPLEPDYLLEACTIALQERGVLRVKDLLEERTQELLLSEADLTRRIAYERAASECIRCLAGSGDLSDRLDRVLEVARKAIQADRSYIFGHEVDSGSGPNMIQLFESCAEGIAPQIDRSDLQRLPYAEGAPSLLATLGAGQPFSGLVSEMPDLDRKFLEAQGILSFMILPINVDGVLWGFIGFDDRVAGRRWPDDDIRMVGTISTAIGTAINQSKAHANLERITTEQRLLLDGIDTQVWYLADENTYGRVNRAHSNFLGYEPRDIAHLTLDEFLSPEVAERCRAGNLEAIKIGRSVHTEEWIPDANGEDRLVQISRIPRLNAKGVVESVVCTGIDITERKREEALREALFNILEASMSSGGIAALAGRIHSEVNSLMDARNFYLATYDKTSDTYTLPYFADERDSGAFKVGEPIRLGRGFTDYVRRKEKPLLIGGNAVKELVEKGEVDVVGSPSASWMGVPLFDDTGVMGVLAIQSYSNPAAYSDEDLRVLTLASDHIGRAVREVRAEAALREAEMTYRNLFLNSQVGLFRTDLRTGHILDANDAVARFFGFDNREELLANPISVADRYVNAEDRQEMISLLNAHGEFEDLEASFRRNDGSIIQMRFGGRLVPERGWIEGVSEDVTDRNMAEKEKEALQVQLLQSQKMEAVGRLAGGVAHDFNNMLGVILGYAEMMAEEVPPGTELSPHLEEIRAAAERSADITRQLLAFARKQSIAPVVLDLNQTVEATLRMLGRLIGENINLSWEPGPGLWPIMMDPAQIDQILANLSVNARDAIDSTGKLTIETENVSLDKVFCGNHPGSVPGEFVELSVSDDGCGMNAEVLAMIFEPFFTTKKVGKGTGLGLATVFGIVKQNAGFIDVSSEPDHGTSFRIYLPRYAGKQPTSNSEDAPKPAPRGSETILLVEDEPSILAMTAEMLKRQGYTVLSSHSPTQAIQMAREATAEIQLLVTDVVMPEMNGRQLAEELQCIYPDLKVLYMSGYTAEIIASHGVRDRGVQFIQKPFGIHNLSVKVRESFEEGV